MSNKEAINKINDVLGSTLLYDDSIDYQLNTDDFEWLEKAKATFEKQINAPLTIEEVKALKKGDVVWLKYNNDHSVQTIEFAGIVGGFFTYYAFGNEMLCSCYLTNTHNACKIYRNKPEEEQK